MTPRFYCGLADWPCHVTCCRYQTVQRTNMSLLQTCTNRLQQIHLTLVQPENRRSSIASVQLKDASDPGGGPQRRPSKDSTVSSRCVAFVGLLTVTFIATTPSRKVYLLCDMGMHAKAQCVLSHAGPWPCQILTQPLTKRWQGFCPTRQPLERGLWCLTQPALRIRRSGFRPHGSRASRAHLPPPMMRADHGWHPGGPSAQKQVCTSAQTQSTSSTRSVYSRPRPAPAHACSTPLHAGFCPSLPQMLHNWFGCMPANLVE